MRKSNNQAANWTASSFVKKSKANKMNMGSFRSVCTSKKGFDNALLHLGVSISAKEVLETS